MPDGANAHYKPIVLKRATAQDAVALFKIRYAAYLPLYGAYGAADNPCTQRFEAFSAAIAAGEVYALHRAQALVGGLQVERAQEGATLLIKELYVSPRWQRRGVASAALRALVLRFAAPVIKAQQVLGDPAAAALLQRAGFDGEATSMAHSDRLTVLTRAKDLGRQLQLYIAPLKREDVARAAHWCEQDGERAWDYRLLWEGNTQAKPDVQNMLAHYAFGTHYQGAAQLDFAVMAQDIAHPLAIASLTRLDWEMNRAELDFLLVDPIWRGHGIGRRACQMICDHARAQYGFPMVVATALERNTAALACLGAAGFTQALRNANRMRGGDTQPLSRILLVRSAKEPERDGA